jgi:TolA-binding protein
MKKIILALAATTALAAAMPAAAQTGGANIQFRIDQLQTQLQTDVRSGAITRAEAMPLREQLRQLSGLERQYRQGGFTVQERNDLQSRIASLRQGIRIAARSGGNRTDRDDRWSDRDNCPPGLERKDNGCMPPGQVGRDGRDGRWDNDDRRGNMMDRNRDGYDDRDLNRDRRIDEREWRMAEQRYGDNDRYDRDDDDRRYDRDDDDRSDDTRRGGVGGLLDNLLGGGGLRVGQRVTANLGAVPSQYRSQYRDGNGVYYRADQRSIYQIDARNDTVLRIYGMSR